MIAFAGFAGAEIDPELQEKAKQAATSLLQSLTYKFANSNHYAAVRRWTVDRCAAMATVFLKTVKYPWGDSLSGMAGHVT